MSKLEELGQRFFNYYSKQCPKVYNLCYDPIGSHKQSRALCGFLFGFIMGLGFNEMIIVDLQFDPYTTLVLETLITSMLSIGCASSIQIRCICSLTIPAFAGKAGRNVLRALVLGYVIAGPIFNLTHNGKVVVQTFACTSQLTYNLTKTKFDMMFEPFQQAILMMKKDAHSIKDTLTSVKDLMSPMVEEIEGEDETKRLKEENDYLDELNDDTKRSEELEQKEKKEIANAKSESDVYETKYNTKIQARCEEQLSRGTAKCRDMFAETYDKCYNTVSVFAAWLLCWPMKLTFVCNLVQALGGDSICDPKGNVDTGIGEGYASLKDFRNQLGGSLKDAKLQYKVTKIPTMINVQDTADTAKAVMHDFGVRKRLFESVMTLIKRCLAFVFLKIILSAQSYHDKYLNDIEHDNIYVTPYFRKIDARRKARGSLTLLPFKKIERNHLVDVFGLKPSKNERTHLMGQSIKLILEMVTATTFVLLDRVFYETLDLVRRHSRLEYTQVRWDSLGLIHSIRFINLALLHVNILIRCGFTFFLFKSLE